MRYLKVIENKIDRAVDRRVQQLALPGAEAYFEGRKAIFGDNRGMILRDNMTYIHGDIAALLTHISAMIAALGVILIVFNDSLVTQFFIFIEIISYTFLAIVCVYILRDRGGVVPMTDEFASVEVYYIHYLKRRYVYTFCSDGVLITTIVFLSTILVHVFALIFSDGGVL